jgi:glutamyl-tRNA reductase
VSGGAMGPADSFVLVGVSHRTAPVDLRERVAFPAAELELVLQRAAGLGASLGQEGRGEAMIVSTCNRVEIYLAGSAAPASTGHARKHIAAFLGGERGVDPALLEPHLYTESGETALKHLFRVASSLDSVVVGEPQILGQVKDAFEAAQKAGTIGALLGQLVPRVFGAAKRVRTETEIDRSSASVASAAVDLSRRIFGELTGREVLVIGAGEMGELAARHLIGSGCGKLHIVNRTRTRGDELVGRLGSTGHATEAHGWEALAGLLVRADVVVCSTGAPDPVVSHEMVRSAMKGRRGRWLCLLDIAVPRDVVPEVGEIDNVYLYDVDALTRIVDEHLEGRRREAESAERIVAEEVVRCREVFRARGVVPTIRALRDHFTSVAHSEAQRTIDRLGRRNGGLSDKDRKDIEMLADSLINKLLHAPLTAIKREAESEALLTAVRTLFDLPEAPAPGVAPVSASAQPTTLAHAARADENRHG